MSSSKEIRIDYYAVFREQRGLSSETRSTDASTVEELYLELQREFGFKLPLTSVRAAVGDAFVELKHPIQTGEKVVFIPPVAGG